MESFDGQHSAADIPELSFFFDLDVPQKLCAGGAEREAPEFRQHYAGDIKEDCAMGSRIACTGAAGSAAAKCLGQRPKEAVHIILHESDIAGGKTEMASQGGAEA